MLSSPSVDEIRQLATRLSYKEYRPSVSATLYLVHEQAHNENDAECDAECDADTTHAAAATTTTNNNNNNNNKHDKLIKIHVYFTTRSIMTLLDHPTRGINRLWRSNAYQSLHDLEQLLINPRTHTAVGYRQANRAMRVCVTCQQLLSRNEFSNHQWKTVGPDRNACKSCIDKRQQTRQQQRQQQTARTKTTKTKTKTLITDNNDDDDDDNDSASVASITAAKIDSLVDLTQGLLRIHNESSSDIDNMVALTEDMLKVHEKKQKEQKEPKPTASDDNNNNNKTTKTTMIRNQLVRRQFNCPDCPRYGRGTFVFFKKVPAFKPVCKCPQCKRITRGRCQRLLPVPGPAKGYGLFVCPVCRDKWGSSRALQNVAQECFTCRQGDGTTTTTTTTTTTMVMPFRLEVYQKKKKHKNNGATGHQRRRKQQGRPTVMPIAEEAVAQHDYSDSDRVRNETRASEALLVGGGGAREGGGGGGQGWLDPGYDDDGSFTHVEAANGDSASVSSRSSMSSFAMIHAESSSRIPSGYQHKCSACATGACRSRRIAVSRIHDTSDGNTVSTSASVLTNSSVDKCEYVDRDEDFDGFQDDWQPED